MIQSRMSKDRFMKHVERFIKDDPTKVSLVDDLIEDGVPKAEIFRRISDRTGPGKSHVSGKREGTMKGS